MIQLLLGKAGTGKTKKMMEMANEDILSIKGELVYIEPTNKHMHDLHRNIRLISTKDFNLSTFNSFYGFLCGIISENYDIEKIYINGLKKIVSNTENFSDFLDELDRISSKFQVHVVISFTTEDENLISTLKKYPLIENAFVFA